MKDIFSFKRFYHYSKLYYSTKYIQLIVMLGFGAIVTLLLCCKMSSGTNDSFNSIAAAQKELRQEFTAVLFMVSYAVLVWTTSISMSGLGCKRFSMRDILIPASMTEKYCLGFLNAAVLTPTLFLLIFWGVSSFAESLYYFPTDGTTTSYIYRGLFDFSPLTIPAGYERVNVFSFNEIFRGIAPDGVSMPPIIAAAYFLSISILMWGEPTFKRAGAIFSALIHLVALIVIGGGIALAFGTAIMNMREYDLQIVTASSTGSYNNLIGFMSIIAPAIIYQVVTFLKFKNLPIKN